MGEAMRLHQSIRSSSAKFPFQTLSTSSDARVVSLNAFILFRSAEKASITSSMMEQQDDQLQNYSTVCSRRFVEALWFYALGCIEAIYRLQIVPSQNL